MNTQLFHEILSKSSSFSLMLIVLVLKTKKLIKLMKEKDVSVKEINLILSTIIERICREKTMTSQKQEAIIKKIIILLKDYDSLLIEADFSYKNELINKK